VVARTRLRDAGVSSAAPAPWTTRKASDSTLVASPHAAEARVKTRTPTRKLSSRMTPLGQPPEQNEQRRDGDRVAVQHPDRLFPVLDLLGD
jgi:hypothetical protein